MKKITLFFILIFLTYKTNAQNITNIYKKVNTSVVTILTESKSNVINGLFREPKTLYHLE